jgi:hypothetical protein
VERIEYIKENWFADDEVSLKGATNITLPDYKGEEKECWHIRGRGWRWVPLRSIFTGLQNNQDYIFSFWAKFDYYSGRGTRCFLALYEAGKNRITYDIHPNSPYAAAKIGDWVLYKFPIKIEHSGDLKAELISFEANITILQAYPEDEENSSVVQIQERDGITPYYIDQELPFREYPYLEQRMVKYHSNLLAPYYPCKEISETSQSQYYEFAKGLYERLFRKPEEFFTKLYEDDAHPNRFNCREYGKPELKLHMKKACDKIEELFQVLLAIGSTGEVVDEKLLIKSDLSKKEKNLLTYMNFNISDGILMHEEYPNIGLSIKHLASKEKPIWSLMYCWFDASYPYLEKTNEKFYDREQFKRLTDWLHEKGYLISIGSGSGIALDYYKSIRMKDDPVGYAIHGDKYHYGFTFEYRYEPRVMQHCEPRIIQFAEVLKNFDTLSDNAKRLILQRTKICDGCRYCNQTDKTGKRPIAAIKLMDGTSRCPYYPGFNYTFESLHQEEVDSIISFLTDLENLIDS